MEINWASAPGVDKEKAINEIVRMIAHAPQKKYNLMSSGIAIRGNYREFIYFQYGFDCDEKYENTLDLASHIQNHINIEITVSEKNSHQEWIRLECLVHYGRIRKSRLVRE